MVMDEVEPDEDLVNGQEPGGIGLRSPSFQDVLPFLEDGEDRESDIDGKEDEKEDEKEEAFFARDDDYDYGGGMNYEPEQGYVLNTPPALDLDDGPEGPSSSGAFASGSSPSAQAAAHREVSHPRPLSSHPSATRFSRPATPSATPQGGKDASVADGSGEDDLEGELFEVFGEVAPLSILKIGKTWKGTISTLSKEKSDLLTKVRSPGILVLKPQLTFSSPSLSLSSFLFLRFETSRRPIKRRSPTCELNESRSRVPSKMPRRSFRLSRLGTGRFSSHSTRRTQRSRPRTLNPPPSA